ncbi:MAG: DUF2490 domain-containing protein [Candidatus Omnitrophota bacterium]
MGKRVFMVIGIVLLLGCNVYAYDDGDFQVWNTEVEEVKINKNSKITLEEEFRFANDASDFFYHHYDGGYVYAMNKFLDLGINYRQVYEKKQGKKIKQENRPHINAILKHDLFGFSLEDRNRLEYRHFDYQPDTFRYRNKFTVKFPWKFTKFKIQPFIADEIFLVFYNKAFTRNRFYTGAGATFTKNLKGELFYLLQSNRDGKKWKQSNVLGVKIKLVF